MRPSPPWCDTPSQKTADVERNVNPKEVREIEQRQLRLKQQQEEQPAGACEWIHEDGPFTQADMDEHWQVARRVAYEEALSSGALSGPPQPDSLPYPPYNYCSICWRYARVPFRWCSFCGDSPSWHHGRCCPDFDPDREDVGEDEPLYPGVSEGMVLSSDHSRGELVIAQTTAATDPDGGESNGSWMRPSLSDVIDAPGIAAAQIARRAVSQVTQSVAEAAGPVARVLMVANAATLAEGHSFSLSASADFTSGHCFFGCVMMLVSICTLVYYEFAIAKPARDKQAFAEMNRFSHRHQVKKAFAECPTLEEAEAESRASKKKTGKPCKTCGGFCYLSTTRCPTLTARKCGLKPNKNLMATTDSPVITTTFAHEKVPPFKRLPFPRHACTEFCQDCTETMKRLYPGDATIRMSQGRCGLDHSDVAARGARSFLWHVCPSCYDCARQANMNDVNAVLTELPRFKMIMETPLGQDARIMIKKVLQREDSKWISTMLQEVQRARFEGRVDHPWNAFQAAFVRVFADLGMGVKSVAMAYHMMKKHLTMHSLARVRNPQGHLFDFLPPQGPRPIMNSVTTPVAQPPVPVQEPLAVPQEEAASNPAVAGVQTQVGLNRIQRESTHECHVILPGVSTTINPVGEASEMVANPAGGASTIATSTPGGGNGQFTCVVCQTKVSHPIICKTPVCLASLCSRGCATRHVQVCPRVPPTNTAFHTCDVCEAQTPKPIVCHLAPDCQVKLCSNHCARLHVQICPGSDDALISDEDNEFYTPESEDEEIDDLQGSWNAAAHPRMTISDKLRHSAVAIMSAAVVAAVLCPSGGVQTVPALQ